jgi:hypothetical protein
MRIKEAAIRWYLAVAVWMAACEAAPAQLPRGFGGGAVGLPEAPESHVLDAAGLFKRDQEKLTELSRGLLELEQRHDLQVFVAIYGGILSGGVTNRAQELYDAWIGGGKDGIVVVCDTDTRALDIGLPQASFSGVVEDGGPTTRLPDYRMIPIMRRLQAELSGEQDQVEYLDQMVTLLVVELDRVMSAKPAGLAARSTWQFILLVITIGLLLAGLGLVGQRYLRRADQKARERYYLPDVLVGSRLGAPCGGGRVSEAAFPEEPPGE